MTMIVGGALAILLAGFLLRLTYTIGLNLSSGQKLHHSLEQEFNKLRLNNMLSALGINKIAYIYQTRVCDLCQQMYNCKTCTKTDICDEKMSDKKVNISEIEFCNNESQLADIKLQQTRSSEVN